MPENNVLVTGSAGFIGFHLCELLLQLGYNVIGIDAITDYYDVKLKYDRLNILKQHEKFTNLEIDISDAKTLRNAFEKLEIHTVIHLAAQAGVRHSIDNPDSYLNSNIIGTYNILEKCVQHEVKHLLMASTSSVYGANVEMPFKEGIKTETPLSFYAATKKANEVISHSYAYIHNLPITNFRFFTVYGPWGRPDMALFKFVKSVLQDEPIEIYNNGDMYRDFTYVTDLVRAIQLLITKVPDHRLENKPASDTISPVAPWRVVNIGNSNCKNLMTFIEAIENKLGKKAIKKYLPMQLGDVQKTWADCALLQDLTNFKPNTSISTGISEFCDWYIDYYGIEM